MTAAPPTSHGFLAYASPHVPTSPPRTALRMLLAGLKWVMARLLALVRLMIVALAYTVLGVGIVLRFALALVAMLLLLLGGLRWDLVKSRTLGAAQWVDVKVLNTIRFVRRQVDRLPPHGAQGGAAR